MVELLPCPFCGGEAEILTAESMHGGLIAGIMCNYCSARSDVYDTEAEAIAAWNTRTERTCKIENYKDDYITCKAYEKDEFYGPHGKCSECGAYIPIFYYCPCCGAKVAK